MLRHPRRLHDRRISPRVHSRNTARGCSTVTTSTGRGFPRRCDARRRPRCRSSPARVGCRRARVVTVVAHLGKAVAPWMLKKRRGKFADAEASRSDISHRLRVAAERLGPTYIKLGQIISAGDGLFPAELVCGVQEVPRSGDARALRRGPPDRRTGSRRPPRGCVQPLRGGPARGRIDRPGPCRHAALRRAGRRQGAAHDGGVARAQGPQGHGLVGAAPRRAHPGGGAGESADPGGAVRRDDRRGARLPDGGRRHARHRDHAARSRPGPLSRPAAASDARDASRVGDGAGLRLQLRRRRRHAGRRDRHRGGRADRDDRLHGGRHRGGHLPRRSPRRQPLRARRWPDRAARPRHRRTPDRCPTQCVPAPDARCDDERTTRGQMARSAISACCRWTPTSRP